MNRTIILKELRDVWWMGLLAAVLIALPVLAGMGFEFDDRTLQIRRTRDSLGGLAVPVPFTTEDLHKTVCYGAAGLGLLLGLWQTLSESVQGTWQLLLHRPVERRTVILSKLAAGLLVLLVSTGIPLLVYLVWAMMPATHPRPFALWMTQEVFIGWLSGTVFYLAGFLCGIRPARWWGSRLFPLVFVGILALLAWEAIPALTGLWFWILLLTSLVYAAAILFAARHRDYA